MTKRRGQADSFIAAGIAFLVAYVFIGAIGDVLDPLISSFTGPLRIVGILFDLMLPGPEELLAELVKIIWGMLAGLGVLAGTSH